MTEFKRSWQPPVHDLRTRCALEAMRNAIKDGPIDLSQAREVLATYQLDESHLPALQRVAQDLYPELPAEGTLEETDVRPNYWSDIQARAQFIRGELPHLPATNFTDLVSQTSPEFRNLTPEDIINGGQE